MKLALICGGPSKERDISLNSVRSVFDHLRTMPNIEVQVLFMDKNFFKYRIDERFLYSNTASDFEFMLSENEKIDESTYLKILKSVDLVFPVMHGTYGEDGQLQAFLESNNIPYVASPSKACEKMYNKENAEKMILQARNMTSIPKLFLHSDKSLDALVNEFMTNEGINDVIIKPIEGGSSIGVSYASSINNAIKKAKELIKQYKEIVVEKMCVGREFTIIILESNNQVVSLLPTEIELLGKNKKSVVGDIFDKRKKYLSTTDTDYYCPARFGENIVAIIRKEAETLFSYVGAHDFLRIDGWLFNDNSVYFSDFNPISGMEQNSFIFQQAAIVGLRHKDLLTLILRNACNRYNIDFVVAEDSIAEKQRLNLLLGGTTSERQVSLMSGTNAWLKLLNSSKYYPIPYILFSEEGEYTVYEVPYAAALKHTTEEIYEHIVLENVPAYVRKLKSSILKRLDAVNIAKVVDIKPTKQTLAKFIQDTREHNADIFIGLHGGFGENGELQALLEQSGIHFNGAGSSTAKLCMDKFATGKIITKMNLKNVRTCLKIKIESTEIVTMISTYQHKWDELCAMLNGSRIVAKPNSDGCSTGIVILSSAKDFKTYLELLNQGYSYIPESTFADQPEKIQLPNKIDDILFEEYIETQKLEISDGKVKIKSNGDWTELTIGVLEKHGQYHALYPSVTVADNAVLSLEEKFQGGTGVNLTPPPEHIISTALVDFIKNSVESVSKTCGIKDYCRIDIFANNKTGEIIIIEINTLPGLSPSTVLFQQGAKETPPMYPMELLEYIISNNLGDNYEDFAFFRSPFVHGRK
ncbi:MAG: hypothetical protein K2K41_02470, partial [Ruminiclostridium sp.]|nr:hypothetical protein [Ruminiclostridium sp.]